STGVNASTWGSRVAFRAVGFRPAISQLALWSANLRDYTFDTAPIDWWVGRGEWDVTNRWSCTPDWSWFGGFSEEIASIWHKQRLEGDVVLDFYAGPKMIVLNNQKLERISDFNATLCGDGRYVESGYAFLVAPDGAGARLLRQGRVVASNDRFRPFAQNHNRWANVRVEKRGARLSLFFEGQLVLQYHDPEPLSGGYAAVWTRRNGMMLPRITLYFERLGGKLLSLAGADHPTG
ncbi:MAG: hypothetical protein QHJ73_14145, partial [Armatimonadota bacterium]|nr:hypothetical protein [Armatimonadota bacterium]